MKFGGNPRLDGPWPVRIVTGIVGIPHGVRGALGDPHHAYRDGHDHDGRDRPGAPHGPYRSWLRWVFPWKAMWNGLRASPGGRVTAVG